MGGEAIPAVNRPIVIEQEPGGGVLEVVELTIGDKHDVGRWCRKPGEARGPLEFEEMICRKAIVGAKGLIHQNTGTLAKGRPVKFRTEQDEWLGTIAARELYLALAKTTATKVFCVAMAVPDAPEDGGSQAQDTAQGN